jgi:adenylate cyclase
MDANIATDVTRPQRMAVLFADVCDSTQLYERLGDAEALSTMSRGLEMAREVAVHGGGRLVKTMGDELMLVFATARQAADSAVAIQEKVSSAARTGGLRLDFRIGFHFGEAIERDGDVFGDSVNTAARLVALAKAGQILTSSSTIAVVPESDRPPMRELDTITVKGKRLDLDVVELLWQATAELTVISRRPLIGVTEVELRHGASTMRLGAATLAITLGRDDHNDVVINDQRASRLHARIERRRDKFALVDSSANGTYITFDGQDEFLLHHQECLLKGRGRISFGRPFDSNLGEAVSFVCSDAVM